LDCVVATQPNTPAHTQKNTHSLSLSLTHTHTHVLGGMHNIHVVTHLPTYIYTHTHTRAYTHTYTHTTASPISRACGKSHRHQPTYLRTHIHSPIDTHILHFWGHSQYHVAIYTPTYIHTYILTYIHTYYVLAVLGGICNITSSPAPPLAALALPANFLLRGEFKWRGPS